MLKCFVVSYSEFYKTGDPYRKKDTEIKLQI